MHHPQPHVAVFQSALFQTNTTVLHTTDCVIVVDPCCLPHELTEIRQYVNGILGDRPLYVIFTHSDWDHIIGASEFMDATFIASEAFVTQIRKKEIMEEIATFDATYYIERVVAPVYPHIDFVVQEDGQELAIGQTRLIFYQANGHTDDGLFIVVDSHAVWITGDYLSDIEFPFIYTSSVRYEETLQKALFILQKHSILCMIPGHGNVTMESKEMERRQQRAMAYIHELRRAVQQGECAEHLMQDYPFPQTMRACHADNIEHLRKELNKQKY